ncbi:MAG: AmmeMemoRadiSam system protein B, partial [Candidatus Aminicenantales bacterium]
IASVETYAMRRKGVGILILFSLGITAAWAQGIRKPACAGTWYPADRGVLSRMLRDFLAQVPASALPQQKPLALISPHAGYRWSGPVSARAYRTVQGKDYRTVVIIAPSHRARFRGCSIYLRGGYETPLGVAQVDEALAKKLSRATGFGYIPQAHSREHAIEMQVPFVQTALPRAKIVPVVMGSQTRQTIIRLADALKKTLTPANTLVVASTDMSHFLPKKQANAKDTDTISLIQAFQTNTLIRKCENGENIMCGAGPVAAVLLYGKNRSSLRILGYSDSSVSGGPESEVVGYLAAALIPEPEERPLFLTDEEKEELLDLATQAIRDYVRKKKTAPHQPESPRLLEKRGAFVTLKKRGRLRGCIGFVEPHFPLYQAVIQAAVYAACQDPRFPPLAPDELDEVDVEVSVLSPPRKITDASEIVVGKHGLMIAKGGKKGLLLPQVAVENRWNRRTFLEQACAKAGLPKDAWKSGAEIFVFEALVFH